MVTCPSRLTHRMVVPCHPVGSAAAFMMFCMTRLDGAAGVASQGCALTHACPAGHRVETNHARDTHGLADSRTARGPARPAADDPAHLVPGHADLARRLLRALRPVPHRLHRAGPEPGRLLHAGVAGRVQPAGPARRGRHRHLRVRAVRRAVRRRDLPRPRRRPVRPAHGLHLLAGLVLDHDRRSWRSRPRASGSTCGASSPASASASSW